MRCTGKRAWLPSTARLVTGGAGMTYSMRWLSHPPAAAGRPCSDRGSRAVRAELWGGDVRLLAMQEREQAVVVVGRDGAAHARAVGERGAPGLHARQAVEDAEGGQLIEQLEVAERGGEHGVDQRELRAGEVRPVAELGFDALELLAQRGGGALGAGGVLGDLEAPDVAEHRRAELHPAAVARALERIRGVQRLGQCVLEVLADHRGLEQHDAIDLEQRHLAERRQREEPVRLGGEVDVDLLEGDASLGERDGDALHVGAQVMADEGELGHGDHAFPGWRMAVTPLRRRSAITPSTESAPAPRTISGTARARASRWYSYPSPAWPP